MSEHTQQADTNAESTETREQPSQTEYVERSDVGVSLTVKLTRNTGTRDQDKIVAKAKGRTLENAREDMEILREYIYNLADTGGCNSFPHQSLLSADTDPFRLDSQFEFSRTYSHQDQIEQSIHSASSIVRSPSRTTRSSSSPSGILTLIRQGSELSTLAYSSSTHHGSVQ